LNKYTENINSSALSFSSENENVSFDNNTITNPIEMASQPIIPIENIELIDKLDVSAVSIEPVIGADEIIQSENESESEDKKLSRRKINMPKLKLNSTSSLSKWVKKDLTNTNQKDRVYALSEKSNLDLNNSFVGNISQLKFQSMSTVRWIDIANQQKISQQISFDGYLREAKAGLGIISNYSNFSNGLIQDWNLNLIYAPKLAINRYLTIEPSMKYTFGKKVLNSSKVINNSTVEVETNQLETFSIDPNQAIGKNLWYRDLGAGLIINAGPIYFGGHSSSSPINDSMSTIIQFVCNINIFLYWMTDFIIRCIWTMTYCFINVDVYNHIIFNIHLFTFIVFLCITKIYFVFKKSEYSTNIVLLPSVLFNDFSYAGKMSSGSFKSIISNVLHINLNASEKLPLCWHCGSTGCSLPTDTLIISLGLHLPSDIIVSLSK
jgi:hypothetical protein